MISRRRFLSNSVAVGAAAAVLPSMVSQFAFGATPASKLKLGIQLYSLRGFDVDKALKSAKELGFEQVEFYSGMFPLESSAEAIAAMRKKVEELGLTISAHGVNGFGMDQTANRKVFEFAKAAGIKNISADPDPKAMDCWMNWSRSLIFELRFTIMVHVIATTKLSIRCELLKVMMNVLVLVPT